MIEVVKGGVIVLYKAMRIFVPASQATASRGEDLNELMGQEVRFRIIEVNRQRRRAVGSIRSVLREERKAAQEKFWEQVEEGQHYTGKVKSLTSFGAFVDLGGVDGMVHISELSWNRIKHPSEVLSVGDTVEVYVKGLDRENGKISLGYKRPEDNPWVKLEREYPVGSVSLSIRALLEEQKAQEDEEAAQAPAEDVVYSTEAPAQEEEPAAEEQE